MARHQVIVGNIGTVLDIDNGFTARCEYNAWVRISRDVTTHRAYGEPVTLMTDGEPAREYAGAIDAGESE